MAQRAPILTVNVESVGDDLCLELGWPSQGGTCNVYVPKSALESFRGQLAKFLSSFKDDYLSKLTPTVTEAGVALDFLYRTTSSLAFDFFGHDLETVFGLFRAATGLMSDDQPPIIVLTSRPQYYVPLEVLPLFTGDREWQKPKSDEDIKRAARWFVGFSAVVQRKLVFSDRETGDFHDQTPVLDSDPLPLKFFCDSNLPGANLEAAFFAANDCKTGGSALDLEGPWPKPNLGRKQMLREFAEHLWHANQRFTHPNLSNPKLRRDEIQHFSCHCEYNKDPLKCRFTLADGKEVSMPEIKSEFYALTLRKAALRSMPRPIIFFNGCSSAVVDPAGPISFPDFFLRQNLNRGFIGTEARIPDEFAAHFSKAFYTYFLGAGYPLGTSIHLARLHMLREYRNPLGVLYSVYANPYTRVRSFSTVTQT